MKNNVKKFLFLKARKIKGKSIKDNPAFRKLFTNYIKKDLKKEKKEKTVMKKSEGYGSI